MNTKTSSRRLSQGLRPLARGMVRCAAVGAVASLITSPAQAAFHLWNIREVYSDASGSLQFIELFSGSSGQNFLGGQSITVTPVGGASQTFTIPANISSATASHALLFGTAGIQALGAPTPDYILPNNFLFQGGGTISFFGANSGAYLSLPIDGLLSRTWSSGGNALNTPQNFAGQVGMLTPVPEPSTFALLGAGAFGLWLMHRRRSA